MRHVQVLNPDYSQARGRKEMFEKFRSKVERLAAEIEPHPHESPLGFSV